MWSAAGDRDLWVVGGGPVASDLVEADLLDESLLTVVPIVLGSGSPVQPADRQGNDAARTRPSPTE